MRSIVLASLIAGSISLCAMARAFAGDCPHCIDYAPNPSPSPLGTLDITDEPFDLDLRGDIVYLAISSYQNPDVHELVTVDVSDPTSPQLLDTVDSPFGHRSVAVEGDHAYVAFPHLAKFDVSDPSAIEMVGSLDFGVFPGEVARQVAVDGDLAFVITDVDGQSGDKLRIIDVSGDPAFLGALALPYWLNDLAVRLPYVYAVGGSGVHVVDVSDPLNPTFVETIGTENQVTDIELAGNVAVLSVFERAARVMTIADPGAPAIVGQGPSLARIAADGDLVYAQIASSLALFDVSDPSTMTEIGRLGGVYAFFLAVDGCRVATINWFIGDELRMFPPDCGATAAVETPLPSAAAGRAAWSAPNPFRTETRIEFESPGDAPVGIAIFDVTGRLVRRLEVANASSTGSLRREAVWDGRDEGGRRTVPGTYYFRTRSGGESQSGQLTLLP